ncbi:phosphatase PAP2 family protein [Kutzneria albida]|uniref:phosphatase PAP2 family protein n=1 Tax=Kutzneria albida TaxID=43357 RepID=UPI00046D0137|nr:phosphatase PAP2 family protein [Kutzneria albida]
MHPDHRLRQAITAYLWLSALVVAALSALTWHGRRGTGLDLAVDGWIERTFSQDLLRTVVHLADLPVLVGVLALVLVLALVRRDRELALLAVLGPTAAMLLTELVLKPLVHRTYGSWLAFPSGHTTAITATATVLALLAARLPLAARTVVHLLLLAAVVVVAIALIGLDYHYFTDTVGGFFVATACVLLVSRLLDRTAD